MMTDTINVLPNDVVKSCVKVQMSIMNFELNAHNCTVNVRKLDASGFVIDVVNVFICDEEYDQWSFHDDYIINLVLDKLGLVRDETVVETTP